MNNLYRKCWFLLTPFFIVSLAWADIRLPAVFSDHMVLQRNSEVTFWGWAIPNETVSIIPGWLNGDTIQVQTGNMGKWSARIQTGEAGGPYIIQFKGSSEKVLSDIMLGEVWLCSGQSNMEWSVNHGIQNGEEEAQQANFSNLRIFHLPQIGASSPQENCQSQWMRCTPETMRRTSAIGYFFGRNISEELNVPVGIIVAAWGGTPAEVWTPRESVMSDPVLSDYFYGVTPWWPVEPGSLYNSMIHPITPYEIAGCIWYQGEANHTRADSYARLMHRLITSWRTGFNKELPFYLVQIAPFTYQSKDNGPARLREQQAMLPTMMKKVKMINIPDLVDNISDIHPRDKKSVGHRLSYLALDDTYGKFVNEYQSPVFKDARLEKNKIIISFDEIKKGLEIRGEQIHGLKIAGEDMLWKETAAIIKGNELILSIDTSASPLYISYCFDDDTIGNLYSKEGLPVIPFYSKVMN